MLALQRTPLVATGAERAAVASLMAEPEAVVSDAPVAAPHAAGVLLALLLLGPKKEPKDK